MKYLFMPWLNNSGSTLMHHIIASATKTATLPCEGVNFFRIKPANPTSLYGKSDGVIDLTDFCRVPRVWFSDDHRPTDAENIPWDIVGALWKRAWKLNNPNATLCVEKSPVSIQWVDELDASFPNAHFLFGIRDPIKQCASSYVSLLRRRGNVSNERRKLSTPICLASHWRNCATRIRTLIYALATRSRLVRYEDLVTDPNSVFHQLSQFLPELEDVRINRAYTVHGKTGEVSSTHSNSLRQACLLGYKQDDIKRAFENDGELLSFFNYSV